MQRCRMEAGGRGGRHAKLTHRSLAPLPLRNVEREGLPHLRLSCGRAHQSAGRGGGRFPDGLLLPRCFEDREPPRSRRPWRSDSGHPADVAGRLPHGCALPSLAAEPRLRPGLGCPVPPRLMRLSPLAALDTAPTGATRDVPWLGARSRRSWLGDRNATGGVLSPLWTSLHGNPMPPGATAASLLTAEATTSPTPQSAWVNRLRSQFLWASC